MWHDLRRFMAQRCPLPAILPLALILYGAPALLVATSWSGLLRGVLSTLGALVTLRMVDDLASLEEDRRCHPERGLVSGRIDPANLKRAAALGIVAVAGLNLSPSGGAVVGLALGAYLLFYRQRKRLSVVWQPLWVNLIFALIPIYAAGWSLEALLLSLFIWLAVVGHDYAHSVHGLEEGCREAPTPSSCWGPRQAALAGAGAYLLALAAGIGFWLAAGRPPLFALALTASTLALAAPIVALLIQPCRKRAKTLYVPGFLFFVLPLAGFIVDRLML